MGGRGAVWALAALLCTAGASCATIYAPALTPGQTARVKLVSPDPRLASDGYRSKGTFNVSEHDYANGCPQVASTRTSRGFKGKIVVSPGATKTVDVPTGRRMTFTSEWINVVPDVRYRFSQPESVYQVPCESIVSFVPEPGRTYVIRFPEGGDYNKRACGATAEIEGVPQTSRGPEPIAYPQELHGAARYEPGSVCALGPDY